MSCRVPVPVPAAALLLCAALPLAPTLARAADLDCELPGDRRLLRVELPGENHLCEVSVTYQSGERRVLWYADNVTAFCSDKLDELHTKYTEEWNFTCSEWPTSDGVESLSDPQRRALDRELRARLDDPARAPDAVRVATTAASGGSALIAVQWLADGDDKAADALSVYLDETASDAPEDSVAGWREVAGIEDLGALLPAPADGAIIERALLTGIDANGGVALTTVVTPTEGPNDSMVCRGRQRVALDGRGGLSVRTPHRHACEPLVAELDAG